MELTEISLELTRSEAGALADCLRGFNGMGEPSVKGRTHSEEDRTKAKANADEVYKMVSPVLNGTWDSDEVIAVPREKIPQMERVLSRLLQNPMVAVHNICLEWADDYNTHLRGRAYRTLGWVADVEVSLEQISMQPDKTDKIHNHQFPRYDVR